MKYDVIAYDRPSSFEQSITTHVCIEISANSRTRYAILIGISISILFMVVVTATVLLMCSIKYKCSHDLSSAQERQRLLRH